jgi:magnesium chelatase family protein
MLATVLSGAPVGINGLLVEVEVDIALGLPQFTTVGLPEGAVKESKDRVRSAIKNSGYEFPSRKVARTIADLAGEEQIGGAHMRRGCTVSCP